MSTFCFDHKERQMVNSPLTSSPAKITGLMEKQAILRIGTKRRLLFCSDELLSKLEETIPAEGVAEYTDDSLIAFTQK